MKLILLIFLVGLSVGLFLWSTPIADPWVIRVHVFSGATPLLETLMPVYLPYPISTWVHRPLTFLFYNIIYNTLGINFIFYRVFHAFILGMFGCVVFLTLTKLKFNKKFIIPTSILSILSPPILISTWSIADSDVLGAVFVMTAFLCFLNLIYNKKTFNKKFIIFFVFFLIFSLLSVLYKETSRFFLFLFIFSYILSNFLLYRKINKLHLYLMLYIVILSIIFSIPMFLIETPSYFSTHTLIDMPHKLFVIDHIVLQLVYSISISGVVILFLATLTNFKKISFKVIPLIIIFMLFLIMLKPIIFYSFLGMVFLSDSFSFLLFPLLIFSVLIYNLYKKKYHFPSLLILLTLISFIVLLSFLLIPREDISSRAFVYIIPFAIYLIVASFFDSLKNIKKLHSSFLLRLNQIIIIILVVMMLFYFTVSLITISTELQQESQMEYLTRSDIKTLDLNDVLILYTKPLYPLDAKDIEYKLKSEKYNNTGFTLINAHKKNIERMKAEFCGKLYTRELPFDKILVQEVREFPLLDSENQYTFLEGDFNWTKEDYIFSFLKPGIEISHWLSDYGIAEYHQKDIYPKSLLNDFLEEKNATILTSYEQNYYKPITLLENLPNWLLNKMPVILKYKIIGKIYYLDAQKLECDGWFPEENYNNVTFRRMYTNATIKINNSRNENQYITLYLNLWSFYKPRTLEIYLNETLIGNYSNISTYWFNNILSVPANLTPGENTIKFHSNEGCDIPYEVGAWEYDIRCVSFAFTNITILTLKDLAERDFLYENNWFPEETYENITYRWMGQDALILAYSQNTTRVRFGFILQSLNKSRTLELYLNNESINSYNISPEWKSNEILTPLLTLKEGENQILFHSKEGCENPTELGLWEGDPRCLSFWFFNITRYSEEEIYSRVFYENNWFPEETYENITYRWMGQDATISIYSQNITKKTKLVFTAWSLSKSRILDVYVNDKLQYSYNINPNGKEFVTPFLEFKQGENIITFHSKEKCDTPYGIGAWENDERCLNLAFKNIYLKDD